MTGKVSSICLIIIIVISQVSTFKLFGKSLAPNSLPEQDKQKYISKALQENSLKLPISRLDDEIRPLINDIPEQESSQTFQSLLQINDSFKPLETSLSKELSLQSLQHQKNSLRYILPSQSKETPIDTPTTPEKVPLYYYRDHLLDLEEESKCFLRTSSRIRHRTFQKESPSGASAAKRDLPRQRVKEHYQKHHDDSFKRYLTTPLLRLRKDDIDIYFKPFHTKIVSTSWPVLPAQGFRQVRTFLPRTYRVEPYPFAPKQIYFLRPQELWVPTALISDKSHGKKIPNYTGPFSSLYAASI